jgi:hypothetical protein
MLPRPPSRPGPAAGLVIALAISLLAPPAARADEPPPESRRRGPLEIEDGHLLAQPRLTLSATSPWTLRRGEWSFEGTVLWSNSFSWTQDEPGENPKTRVFLIDGETATFTARVRYGLGDRTQVGLIVPVVHRGGGVLDGMIDTWHRWFGFEDGSRPLFLRDAYRASGQTTGGGEFSWTDLPGTGLGNVQAEVRWRALDGGDRGPSLALAARLALPTATGPFDGHGLGGAGQLLLGVPLGPRADLYAGAGLIVQDPGPVLGLRYQTARAHGFLAFEWRPWSRVSLVLETDVASRLVSNVEQYPGLHWMLDTGTRLDLGSRMRLDVGLVENIVDQQCTTDVALYFALGVRPGR